MRKIQVKFLMMTSRVLELFLQSAEKVCRDAWDSINETSDSIDVHGLSWGVFVLQPLLSARLFQI